MPTLNHRILLGTSKDQHLPRTDSTQLDRARNFGFARQNRLGNTTCRYEGIGFGHIPAVRLDGWAAERSLHESRVRRLALACGEGPHRGVHGFYGCE